MKGEGIDPILCIFAVLAALVVGAILGAMPKQDGIRGSAFGQIFCDINGELSSTRIMSLLSVLGGLGFIGLNADNTETLEELAVPLSVLFGGAFGGKAIQRHFEKRKDPEVYGHKGPGQEG